MHERITRLVDAAGNAASWLFVAIVAITAYEVVMRYALNAPTIWVHELAIALAATCFVIGGPVVHQRQQHITISVIYERMSPRVQRWARAACSVLTLIFCVLLSHAAIQQAWVALKARETTGTAINWPIPAFLKTLFALAVVVLLVQTLGHLVQDIARLRARGTS
jgi:TRAP-type mannitol/chloroaromatic compound transport system permease small subunit